MSKFEDEFRKKTEGLSKHIFITLLMKNLASMEIQLTALIKQNKSGNSITAALKELSEDILAIKDRLGTKSIFISLFKI